MKSIMQTDQRCFVCGMAIGTETHHIFGAANRNFSDQDGLTIRVCRQCHYNIHFSKISGDLQNALHQQGQEKWEEVYGDRDAFMRRYGRNYL